MTGIIFVNSTDPVVTDITAQNPLPVSIANATNTTPLPVTLNGGGTGTLDVNIAGNTNTAPLPVDLKVNSLGTLNVAMPGVNVLNPLPVDLRLNSVGTLNVAMPGNTSGSPLHVTLDATSMNVTMPGVTSGTPLDVTTGSQTVHVDMPGISPATPLSVTLDATSMNVNIQSQSAAVNVDLVTLLAGENQSKNWLEVADGASQGYHLTPTPTATGGNMPREKVLGTSGAVGDYIKSIFLNVTANTNAAVYLSQDGQTAITSGSSGTAPTGTTSLAVTSTAAFTATQNQYAGRIITVNYVPTGGSTQLTFKRRIVSHAAFAGVTALTFTVSHALPAGSGINVWQMEGDAAFELIPYNTPVGLVRVDLGEKSTYGGWRINTDSTVDAHVVGKFS